ncbi:MAG: hypothetical protein C0410_05805, partial [Anaerolinea sp.]|nr:hypothetical protein [Anaerolinea sp.]
ILKIGVTGHLSLQNSDVIEESFRQILKNIARKYPNDQLSFYSPLSPGADLLSARIAIEYSIPLYVLLPFNQDEYLLTFSADDQKTFLEFLKKAEGTIKFSDEKQGDAYQTLGDFLFNNMDILVAIWNGQEARGPGGTGDVVQDFRKTHKPLAWIRADNMVADQPVFLAESMQQGTIQYENW